jgi:4a-hydroxytetrahydrobiopterin dehydratase
MSWTEKNNGLEKEYTFKDFEEAMDWMLKASKIIEEQNHHPTWTNTYNRVKVFLTTHDARNTITEKDRTLAQLLDRI